MLVLRKARYPPSVPDSAIRYRSTNNSIASYAISVPSQHSVPHKRYKPALNQHLIRVGGLYRKRSPYQNISTAKAYG
eukprot:980391-Rhodomonas_salina.1